MRRLLPLLRDPDVRRGAHGIPAGAPGMAARDLFTGVAVIVHDVPMSERHVPATWHDARLPAVAAATLGVLRRTGVLGPLVGGVVVFLPLHRLWGGTLRQIGSPFISQVSSPP